MSYLEAPSDGEYETVVAATAYAIINLAEERDPLKQKKKKVVEVLASIKREEDEEKTVVPSAGGGSFNENTGGKEAEAEEEENGKQRFGEKEAEVGGGEQTVSGDGIWKKLEEVERATSRKSSRKHTDSGEESSDASPTARKLLPFTKKRPEEKVVKRAASRREETKAGMAKDDKPMKIPKDFSLGYEHHREEDSHGVDKNETNVVNAWEMEKMKKAKKRYEKMMSVISEWQTEKSAKAKRRMEKKQEGPEHKHTKALQHYNKEITRINKIAGDAQALAKERKQNDEMKIREKARKMRSTGKVPGGHCPCC